MSRILYLAHDDLKDVRTLYHYIYPNMDLNYYVSDDFSPSFYVDLAKAGFITIGHRERGVEYLLPEMQFAYAVLDFCDLHRSRNVMKLQRQPHRYRFSLAVPLHDVVAGMRQTYPDCWIHPQYAAMLDTLQHWEGGDFSLMTCGLYCPASGQLVAGELGYRIGRTYTSLGGFTTRQKRYNHFGTLQLVLLARHLESQGYAFWNLGHPYMQYKLDLGARVLAREAFLARWLDASA